MIHNRRSTETWIRQQYGQYSSTIVCLILRLNGLVYKLFAIETSLLYERLHFNLIIIWRHICDIDKSNRSTVIYNNIRIIPFIFSSQQCILFTFYDNLPSP